MNRAEDLRIGLRSILIQTKPPKEVTIVDDSDNSRTMDMIDEMHRDFSDKGITLVYLRGGKKEEKSISRARNVGAAQSTGAIILFMDDDVILDQEYLKEILEFFSTHPEAVGVQGHITNMVESISGKHRLLSVFYNKIFFLFHTEKDRCRLLPSGHITYPDFLSGVIESEWMSGTNSNYRTEVLKKHKWDENLKEWSRFEDVDISNRILKHYPNSLYMIPNAKVIHKYSSVARRNAKQLVYIMTLYHTYFFLKNVEQKTFNRIAFVWSQFGDSLETLFFLYKGESRLDILRFLIGSYLFMLNHFNEVRSGDFAGARTFLKSA